MMFKNWRTNRRKNKFAKQLGEQLAPIWMFDRGGYIWYPTKNRKLSVMRDQVGNWLLFENNTKVLSPYLKTKEETQKFAINLIVDEILKTYYPKFKIT